MTALELISECSRRNIVLTPALDYDAPGGAFSLDLEEALRAGKIEVLRQLIGPATSGPRGNRPSADWRFEWLRETGMLALRWRDSKDHDVKAHLRELLAETPRTSTEWLVLGDLICTTEAELKKVGKLPNIPNFDS